jgi:ribosomal protein L37AE/L43A
MRDASFYRRDMQGPEAELCPRRFWQGLEPFNPSAPTLGAALEVYLNEGRWVVMCPDCNSAQLASQTDPRFMCIECGNIGNGGGWRPLAWPKNRAGIEAALAGRQPVNQNWLPGESVKLLLAEAAVRGPVLQKLER